MKLSLFCCLAALACGQDGDAVRVDNQKGSQTLGTRLRILDWNIHQGNDLAGIIEALQKQEADVAVLQEIDRGNRRTGQLDITAELARRTGMSHAFAAAFRELSQGPDAVQGQATLTRGRITNARVLRYRNQSEFWKPRPWIPNLPMMQRRNGGRVALLTEILAGGRTLAVYNLHLESRSTRIRDLQLEETIQDAARYGDGPVVLAGDLNTLWGTSGVRQQLASAGFRNCFGDRAPAPRTHKVAGALDYIFVRGPVECSSATVVRGINASDHRPIVSGLTIMKQK